ncbi:DUF2569 domain-containing protein [Erythrobacter mangrovi]|uniref:DUF2569 domain-containing protein n=1 Tax=Erythrobacter mangrovi TaxID=2739433 RepID=A0A7D4B7F6_9SPHN|nr:DUF2569 domain-containing protein [Erythrobacter mangrovi]QKG71123.1 DUF2569 domain-containing protein [Erythrobacter mangrovi]
MVSIWHTIEVATKRYAAAIERRSRAIAAGIRPFLEGALPWWILGWLTLAAFKITTALTPITSFVEFAGIFLPYALIGLAPIAGLRLAEAAFPPGEVKWQPSFRLAMIGRWRSLDRTTARQHPLFGPAGFMASLLIGMLLNVVFRSTEFMLAVPAMGQMAPGWGRTLFLAMAFDVIAMNFLYAVCFVMALRTIPYFPRMLAIVWVIDIGMQFAIAQAVGMQGPVPYNVAVSLSDLLQGNITKVLISIFVWLPYLMLSDRVNVTYRSRLSA